jgi:hypothetical protein
VQRLFNRMGKKWHKQNADRNSYARHCPAYLFCPRFATPARNPDLYAPNAGQVN